MAAHTRLKNEFTEEEKYHNLMRWLIWVNYVFCFQENVLMGDICSRNITSMQKACLAKVNDTFDPDM